MVRLLSFLLFSGSVVFAKSGITTVPIMDILVISDSFNADVPEGTFALRGHVNHRYDGHPLAGALIANGAENPFVHTDSAGFYEMLFPISDTAIYCYLEGMGELVFKGPFRNRHLIEVNFYLRDPNVIEICAKPVIYAYHAPSSVSLTLRPVGNLSYMYPAMDEDNQWHISTNEDGTLTDLSTGKNYPYLFWESIGKDLEFLLTGNAVEGYFIQTDSCASFLENVLCSYGLNQKESADFITFWVPRMMQKDYALVQFFSNADYTANIASLDVLPQPESLLRLYMYFAPLDERPVDLKLSEPQITPFSRSGFTVVEWGGSVLQKLPAVH
jgi:hypothetical protein